MFGVDDLTIAVGIGVGILLIGLGVYVYKKTRRPTPPPTPPPPPTTSQPPSQPNPPPNPPPFTSWREIKDDFERLSTGWWSFHFGDTPGTPQPLTDIRCEVLTSRYGALIFRLREYRRMCDWTDTWHQDNFNEMLRNLWDMYDSIIECSPQPQEPPYPRP